MASVQHQEVPPFICVICVKGPVKHYHVGCVAAGLVCVGEEPPQSYVISWSEWVHRRICAAVLYYKHNESRIRKTGNWREGREDQAKGGWGAGGWKWLQTHLSSLCLLLQHTTTRMAMYKWVSNVGWLPAEMFPGLVFLHANARGNLLSPCHKSSVGWVTPASPVVAEMSRWHKPVSHHHIILETFHLE